MSAEWSGPQVEKVVETGEALAERVRGFREAGERIVLTNGSFDLLHVGHLRALVHARAAGDRLVVALNSDASVRRYKGEPRPVVPQHERAELLAGFACVDLVTFFDESTAVRLVEEIRPDVYAKGRDYEDAEIPEAKTARELGAEIVFVGDEKTHGASDLIERIRELVVSGRL